MFFNPFTIDSGYYIYLHSFQDFVVKNVLASEKKVTNHSIHITINGYGKDRIKVVPENICDVEVKRRAVPVEFIMK